MAKAKGKPSASDDDEEDILKIDTNLRKTDDLGYWLSLCPSNQRLDSVRADLESMINDLQELIDMHGEDVTVQELSID